MRLSLLICLLSAGSLVACNGKSPEKEIQKSVKLNQEAPTKTDWELSDSTPEALFGKWRQENASSEEICKSLHALDGEKLSLFEEEIERPENAGILEGCKADLQAKLETYWSEQKPGSDIMDIGAGVRFQGGVVTRDFSQGLKIVSGDLAARQVVLTFDDGPHPSLTGRILNSLSAVNAKAIFFALGRSVKANPGVLQHVASQGHAIGSHSVTHKCLPFKKICQGNNGRMLSFEEAKQEIIGGHRAVFNAIGWVDPFFRFPYGESSAELSGFLRQRGVGEFFWSVDSNDWRAQAPETLVQNTMRDLNARGKGVLLFHDVQRRTAEALPSLLRELYFGGYSVVLMKSSDPDARNQSRMLR